MRLRVCVLGLFFQAEDGIRDDLVTGVQTCALPIYVDIDGNWLHGIVTEDEASSKGYRWETKRMVKILNPVNKCEWIDDAIGTFKEINILFCYDRFCRLGTQKKILSKETLITYRDVLNFVDNFYGGNLTRNELELIMKTEDGFGYSDKAKDAFNNNTSLRRIEV